MIYPYAKLMNRTEIESMVSHEFKTPLSGILTSAGLIEKYNEKATNEKIAKHSTTIQSLAIQINNMLDDFISLEKTESENYPLRLSKFKLCDVINRLLHDSKAILKEGQRIEITPCKVPIEVWQDRKALEIIINNVLYALFFQIL